MKYEAKSPEEYINQVPDDKKKAFEKLRKVIVDNLPDGYQEEMSYGMLGYVVPHDIYKPGYHVDPKLPLPFINLAAQKNFIALYHMGIYTDTNLLNWFEKEYASSCKTKLDMGKSCIRLKKPDDIPFELIGELVSRMSVTDWIEKYEASISKR